MKSVDVKIMNLEDIIELCKRAVHVTHGDILARRGNICVDMRSLIGVAMMPWDRRITVSYVSDSHDEALAAFEEWLYKFKVSDL